MKDHIAHSGAWGIALIVIVVASWFLYRYLAPKTWKEWRDIYDQAARRGSYRPRLNIVPPVMLAPLAARERMGERRAGGARPSATTVRRGEMP